MNIFGASLTNQWVSCIGANICIVRVVGDITLLITNNLQLDFKIEYTDRLGLK